MMYFVKQKPTNKLNMKDDQQSFSFHHHLNNKKTRLFSSKPSHSPAACVIILLLGYALGFLSSFRLPSLSSSKPANVKFHNQLRNFQVTTHCADLLPSTLVRQTILDRIYNGTSPYHNLPPPHVSKILRYKSVKGWGSYGAVFENLIRRVKPKVIVEVGTFLGASALHMAQLTRQLGLESQILCVDDFRGWPGFRDRFKDVSTVNGDVLLLYQFMQNVIHWNVTRSILPVPFSSGSALEKLCEWGVFGDLIEIDAGHDFNSAWADINRAYRILKPGGVIFGHDYFTAADNRGARRAVKLFAQLHGLKIQTDGQHWVIDSTQARPV